MRYRLKKDLPFAKVETDVYNFNANKNFNEGDEEVYIPLTNTDIYKLRFVTPNQMIYIGQLSELISRGWIEEVKPREWYAIDNDNPMFLHKDINTLKGNRKKIIKVREVLE